MKHFLLKKIKRVGATLVNHVFQAHDSVTRRLQAARHVVPRSLVCPRHHEFARLCPPQRPHAPRSRVCALCVCHGAVKTLSTWLPALILASCPPTARPTRSPLSSLGLGLLTSSCGWALASSLGLDFSLLMHLLSRSHQILQL